MKEMTLSKRQKNITLASVFTFAGVLYCGRRECDGEFGFERLRRITGYLVGSLERWNDGKKAEEKARVKHNVKAGQYDVDTKVKREAKKASAKKAVGKN